MACPFCGELCTCPPADDAGSERVSVLIDPEQFNGAAMPTAAVQTTALAEQDFYRPQGDWRQEVASRLQEHRAKRRRYDPESSLPLGFEEPVLSAPEPEPPHPLAHDELAEIERRLAQRRREKKLIEFPRASNLEMFSGDEGDPDELAEALPVLPRILEATDLLPEPMTQPVLGSIHLDEERLRSEWNTLETETVPIASFKDELPLQTAEVSPRVSGALLDGLMVLAACMLFSMIALISTHYMPEGKAGVATVLAMPLFFGLGYQLLFLYFSGATPGMEASRLELVDLEGYPAPRRLRALRAAAEVMSVAPLGLGYLWALVDEDGLCWHDRITGTYLRQY